MRDLAFVLLLALAVAVCGCESVLSTDYDGRTDVITCTVVHEWNENQDKWTEKGDVCHENRARRIRPIASLPFTPEAGK